MSQPLELFFHNTLSGNLECFVPLVPGEVSLYTCGPTVYDFAHIGNFRTFAFEDLLRRLLETSGYRVKHVMNITDVDDKTIAGALKEGVPLDTFTEKYTRAFQEDLQTLNILSPNWPGEQPRATREIPAMIDLISKLIAGEHAYESEGSVYYRVASFPEYGKLSKKNLEKNIAGARVEVDEYEKEEASDFVLWKKAKEGEPSWKSPWGEGRPGWHIECSAMSIKYLGESFDIHAGGEDLVFPHHENEIAQSEAATETRPFVRCWLHSKHLLVNGEKMSKSKGNFFTLRDLLAKGFDPMSVRFVLLSVHYRSPLNFTFDALKEAEAAVEKICDAYYLALSYTGDLEGLDLEFMTGGPAPAFQEGISGRLNEVRAALSQDLNVAEALSSLFAAVNLINKTLSSALLCRSDIGAVLHFFEEIDRSFGLDTTRMRQLPGLVRRLVNERHRIRNQADFKKDKTLQSESDRLRALIQDEGWLVKDTRPGQPLISTVKVNRKRALSGGINGGS